MLTLRIGLLYILLHFSARMSGERGGADIPLGLAKAQNSMRGSKIRFS